MKKLVILIALIAIVSCEKKPADVVPSNIMLRGQIAQPLTKGTYLTPVEISKQANRITLIATQGDLAGRSFSGGFDSRLRDTINGILMLWPDQVLIPNVGSEGYTLVLDFITAENTVLERNIGTSLNPKYDTIAYIPNATLKAAYDLILPAYEAGNWQEIYDVFKEKFLFISTTGSDYKELMKQGLN